MYRDRRPRAIEAHPMTTRDALAEELHVGTRDVFAEPASAR
jgi:hypothetical protein